MYAPIDALALIAPSGAMLTPLPRTPLVDLGDPACTAPLLDGPRPQATECAELAERFPVCLPHLHCALLDEAPPDRVPLTRLEAHVTRLRRSGWWDVAPLAKHARYWASQYRGLAGVLVRDRAPAGLSDAHPLAPLLALGTASLPVDTVLLLRGHHVAPWASEAERRARVNAALVAAATDGYVRDLRSVAVGPALVGLSRAGARRFGLPPARLDRARAAHLAFALDAGCRLAAHKNAEAEQWSREAAARDPENEVWLDPWAPEPEPELGPAAPVVGTLRHLRRALLEPDLAARAHGGLARRLRAGDTRGVVTADARLDYDARYGDDLYHTRADVEHLSATYRDDEVRGKAAAYARAELCPQWVATSHTLARRLAPLLPAGTTLWYDGATGPDGARQRLHRADDAACAT